MAYNSYPMEVAPVSYESTGCGGCGDCGCGSTMSYDSYPVEGGYIVGGTEIQGCPGGDCGGSVVYEDASSVNAEPVQAPETDGEEDAPSEESSEADTSDDDKKEA